MITLLNSLLVGLGCLYVLLFAAAFVWRKKRRNMLRAFLMDVTEALDDLDESIVLWADYGTLLGAIRDRDIIDGDDDLDFGFFVRDHAVLLEHLKRKLEGKYRVEDRGAGVAVRLKRISTHADFFAMRELPEDHPQVVARMSGEALAPRHLLGSASKRARIWNTEVRIPDDAHEWLRHRYGDDYETPRYLAKDEFHEYDFWSRLRKRLYRIGVKT